MMIIWTLLDHFTTHSKSSYERVECEISCVSLSRSCPLLLCTSRLAFSYIHQIPLAECFVFLSVEVINILVDMGK